MDLHLARALAYFRDLPTLGVTVAVGSTDSGFGKAIERMSGSLGVQGQVRRFESTRGSGCSSVL